LSLAPASVITVPPHEWPTSTTLPGWLSMARRVAATSPASDSSPFCTACTFTPLACSSGMTLAQSEPSANAPCTITTEGCPLSAAGVASAVQAAVRPRPATASDAIVRFHI